MLFRSLPRTGKGATSRCGVRSGPESGCVRSTVPCSSFADRKSPQGQWSIRQQIPPKTNRPARSHLASTASRKIRRPAQNLRNEVRAWSSSVPGGSSLILIRRFPWPSLIPLLPSASSLTQRGTMPLLSALLLTSLSLLASLLPLFQRHAALRDSPSEQYAPSLSVCPTDVAVRRPSTEVSDSTMAVLVKLIWRRRR